jgi:hypothetical protein
MHLGCGIRLRHGTNFNPIKTMNHKVHYVSPELEKIFLWTDRAKTSCGKSYESIEEYSSDMNYVTCKKCRK